MIPLQMEKIAWPPVGSMGPIFSEYLYIRFYSGGSGNKYWADAKFQELLMQLQLNNVIPDEKLIKPEYKNWWIPVAEEIVIKTDGSNKNKTEKKDKQENRKEDIGASPDVFLSYQWGKQKQIQALYQRLTGLGFSCWMDIHQMGGGDSLYDKIDKGVRGCKVVVTSITQKYALSANCRREVSLADALKKPIIPILLEEIDWPPSGPMSMVFTQLLYINFCEDPDIQMKWNGKKFDELLEKVKAHIPDKSSVVALQQTQEQENSVDTKNLSVENNVNIANESTTDEKETNQSVERNENVEGKIIPTTVIEQKDPVSNIAINETQSSTPQERLKQSNSQATKVDNIPQNKVEPVNTKKSSTCSIL